MNGITVEYKGFHVSYSEDKNEWIVYEGTDGYKSVSSHKGLALAKKAIDNVIRGDFQRIPVLIPLQYGYGSDFTQLEAAEVTSHAEDGKDAWIITPEGKRRTVRFDNLILNTPANCVLYTELRKAEAEALASKKAWDAKVKAISARFERYDPMKPKQEAA